MRKHIVAYQVANQNRDTRIEELKKEVEAKQALIRDLEEKKKDYELIIKAYQDYAEQERKNSDEQYNKGFDEDDDAKEPVYQD